MTEDHGTNRLVGARISYDLNGNMSLNNSAMRSIGYDVENRVAGVTAFDYSWESYKYSARNERLVVKRGGTMPASWEDPDEVHFHGVDGLLLGVYRIERGSYQSGYSWVYPVRVEGKERIYFHGRLIAVSTDEYTAYRVITDRLGSVVRHGTASYRYYPYGQEVGGATANDKPKFGTYTRDAVSGLDYAMNRYYYSSWGRFTSPDPYQASGGTADPGSWNRYAYVGGDPVNYHDPAGLFAKKPDFTPSLNAMPNMFDVFGIGEGPMAVPEVSEQEEGDLGLGPTGGMGEALRLAKDALADENCKKVFNTSGIGESNPYQILWEMNAGSSKYGRITFSSQVPPSNMAHFSVTNGTWKNGNFVWTQGDIVINDSPGFWDSSSPSNRALTLLHELGHAYALLDGLGGSKIVYDAILDGPDKGKPDPDKQKTNIDTLAPCRKALGIP